MMKYSLIIFSLFIGTAVYASEASDSTNKIGTDDAALTGHEIFKTFCADACHQAPDRSRLKPKQWRVVLNTMRTRMKSAGWPLLSEDQTRLLLDYLSEEN